MSQLTPPAPQLPAGCPWQLQIVRAVLRGTHDGQSPLRQLRAQDDLEEIIRRWAWPEVYLNALLAEMLKANPDTTEEQLWNGLTLHRDRSIDAWDLDYCNLSVLPKLFGGVFAPLGICQWFNANH